MQIAVIIWGSQGIRKVAFPVEIQKSTTVGQMKYTFHQNIKVFYPFFCLRRMTG